MHPNSETTKLKNTLTLKHPNSKPPYRVSAKRTLRCNFHPDAARRLVFLGQIYMVLIDHISKSASCINMQTRKKLHGRVLEKIFLFSLFILSYTQPCKIWNFLSSIAPLLKSFGKVRTYYRKEEIKFYKNNLENLGRPNLVSASRTP